MQRVKEFQSAGPLFLRHSPCKIEDNWSVKRWERKCSSQQGVFLGKTLSPPPFVVLLLFVLMSRHIMQDNFGNWGGARTFPPLSNIFESRLSSAACRMRKWWDKRDRGTHTHTQATDRDGAIRRKQDRGQTRGEKETAGKTETTAQMEASNKTVYCMDTAALAKTTVAATMHCKKNMLIKAPIIIRVPLPKAHEKNLERAAPFSYSKRRNP